MFPVILHFLTIAAIFAAPLAAQNPPPPPPPTPGVTEQAPAPSNGSASKALDFSKGMDDAWHPNGEKEFKEAVGVKKIKFKQWHGLQLYCDDPKLYKTLSSALGKAWPDGIELLGTSPIPEGMQVRVVALSSADALKAYWDIVNQGADLWGTSRPPEVLYAGLLKAGSTRWNLPPTIFLRPGAIPSSAAPTRAVHDLGVLLASWACSYSGYGGPEFLTEGFAGMLERRSIKNPAAIVSHKKAALTETIHGYGVFAGLGAAMNDSSNAPNNWPRIIHNAVKSMNKKRGKFEDSERVDSLLLRTHEKFARTDYAYAWAVMEFLFDDMKEDEISRRQGLQAVLKTLKDPQMAGMNQLARSQEFRKLLLAQFQLSPAALHEAFLAWAPDQLPKK